MEENTSRDHPPVGTGPLEGLRVLELTSVVLGPWACQILGDLGAEVIKVEPPRGDSNRQLGPRRNQGMCALFLTCNRNKRSIVLDLKQEAGRRAVLELARRADVLIHNYRPQSVARLGLEYEAVQQVNPGIIYCGTYGYRSDGPYGDKPAYDDSIQAASGAAMLHHAVTGDEPRYLPTVFADKTTALGVVYAVLAALYHRVRTGEGQAIEVPMFESVVSYLLAEHLYGFAFEPPVGGPGYRRLMTRERKPYRTRDGYIAILPYLNAHWEVFCRLAGRDELITDERFRTLPGRLKNNEAMHAEVARTVRQRTTAEWLEILGDSPVPTMVVNSLEDLLEDPHLEETGFFRMMEHPTEGTLRTTALPVSFSRTPGSIRRVPPRLGEHSIEVLREIGLEEEEIEAMLASGATATPD